jgi:hypothetical protein
MKKRSIVVFSFILAFLLFGCSGGNTPTAAAKKFMGAVLNNDSKKMEEVATPETMQVMAMFGSKLKGQLEQKGADQGVTDMNKLIFTETINGDEATVILKAPNGAEIDSIHLVRVDGKWKVVITF